MPIKNLNGRVDFEKSFNLSSTDHNSLFYNQIIYKIYSIELKRNAKKKKKRNKKKIWSVNSATVFPDDPQCV